VWGDRKRSGGWVVELVEPNVALVMKTADPKLGWATTRDTGIGFEFQWTFALRPTPDGTTRLLIRERTAYGRRLTRWLMAPVGLVSFVMTRKMLDRIRVRAESNAPGSSAPPLPPAWLKHLFWRAHRWAYRLFGSRVLRTTGEQARLGGDARVDDRPTVGRSA